MLGKLITFPKCSRISQVIIPVEYLAWHLRTSCTFLFGSRSGLQFLATKYLSSNICSVTDLEKNTSGKCKVKQKAMCSFSFQN